MVSGEILDVLKRVKCLEEDQKFDMLAQKALNEIKKLQLELGDLEEGTSQSINMLDGKIQDLAACQAQLKALVQNNLIPSLKQIQATNNSLSLQIHRFAFQFQEKFKDLENYDSFIESRLSAVEGKISALDVDNQSLNSQLSRLLGQSEQIFNQTSIFQQNLSSFKIQQNSLNSELLKRIDDNCNLIQTK
jgi:chromosome segregation ATPase